MLYTTTRKMTNDRKRELIHSHAAHPFNTMSNEDYANYLDQEFISSSYYSTDSEEKGLAYLNKQKAPKGYSFSRFIEVGYKGDVIKTLKVF